MLIIVKFKQNYSGIQLYIIKSRQGSVEIMNTINPSSPNYNAATPSFKALPRAMYKLTNNEVVKVYELEKRDLPFIKEFTQKIKSYMDKKGVAPETENDNRYIIETTFNVIKEKLQRLKSPKTHTYIAVSDSDVCGVMVGGLPKKVPGKRAYQHSSRIKSPLTETELNWCATWNPNPTTERKGVGKIMLSEYIDTMKKDGFNSMFIQSEIPEYSYAAKFYKSMGFREMPCGQIPHFSIEHNKDILPVLKGNTSYDYEIVPMLGKSSVIDKYKTEAFKRYQREVLPEASVNLYSIIKEI